MQWFLDEYGSSLLTGFLIAVVLRILVDSGVLRTKDRDQNDNKE